MPPKASAPKSAAAKAAAQKSGDEQSAVLRSIGLSAGEEVRFRRADRGRWQLGRISCVERDGSITVHSDFATSPENITLGGNDHWDF